jgi:O-antigen/teichoic acid export membrane protein
MLVPSQNDSPVATDDQGLAGKRALRRQRYVRALWSGAGARAVGILVSAASLGLAVRYLGKERYGMWATASTLIAWLALANLGLGHGLTTRISASLGRSDRGAAARAICSTYAIITFMALILLGVGAVACAWVPWPAVFNVASATAIAEARPMATVVVLATVLLLPLSVSGSVLAGYQRSDVANLISGASGVLGLAALYAATRAGASLPVLAAVVLSPLALAHVANTVWVWRRGIARVTRASFSLAEARSMLWIGAQFFVLQIITLIVFEAGAVIIAQRFDAGEVTPYAVTNRMMMLIVTLCNVVLTPLWPAYGEAFACGDSGWVRQVFWRTIRTALAVWAPLAVVLVLAGPAIIHAWAGPAAVPSLAMLIVLVFYALSLVLGMVVAYPLNGIGELSSQLIGGGLMALLHVPLALYLCRKFGPTGVAVSQTVLQLGIAIPFAYAHMFRILKRPQISAQPQEDPVVMAPTA